MAPPDVLGLMILEAHGLAHVARVEVKRKITKEYGFGLLICLSKLIKNLPTFQTFQIPPTPTGPMRELVIDFVDMIRPVEGKRYMLVVVDKFSWWVEACPTKQLDISRWGLPD